MRGLIIKLPAKAMEKSRAMFSMMNRKKQAGLTLIEILIALAILSIALTAIIKSTAQNIKDTMYLQNKTIAGWVALDVMNKARIHLLTLPAKDHTDMLGQSWACEASLYATPNSRIQQIRVTVYEEPSKRQITQLTGYRYAAP